MVEQKNKKKIKSERSRKIWQTQLVHALLNEYVRVFIVFCWREISLTEIYFDLNEANRFMDKSHIRFSVLSAIELNRIEKR